MLALLRALNMMHAVEQDFCQKLCSVFGQDWGLIFLMLKSANLHD